MTDDLLDADCVIVHLENLGIIQNLDWKNPQSAFIKSSEYPVFFENQKSNGDIRLQIIIRSGNHYVSRSIVKILARRHRFNAETILSKCAIATS